MRLHHSLLLGLLVLASRGVAADNQRTYLLRAGTEISLATTQALSSKTSVKGDPVPLVTTADVSVDGHVVIPAGTPAVGEVTDARAKGALGMSGKLAVRALYVTIGDTTVRLGGAMSAKGKLAAGAVVGLAVLTAGFTGRSALISAGAPVLAYVEREVKIRETGLFP